MKPQETMNTIEWYVVHVYKGCFRSYTTQPKVNVVTRKSQTGIKCAIWCSNYVAVNNAYYAIFL